MDSRFRGNDKRLYHFVIPAYAGIQQADIQRRLPQLCSGSQAEPGKQVAFKLFKKIKNVNYFTL